MNQKLIYWIFVQFLSHLIVIDSVEVIRQQHSSSNLGKRHGLHEYENNVVRSNLFPYYQESHCQILNPRKYRNILISKHTNAFYRYLRSKHIILVALQ